MLYLIGGENLYLSEKRLGELKKEFTKRFNGIIKTFNADEVDNYNEILTDADSLALFSQEKLIVLKRVFSSNSFLIDKIHEYLKKLPKVNFIIWEDKPFDKRRSFYRFLKKRGIVEEFNKPNFTKLKTWLNKYLKAKVQYDPACIDSLIIKIGNDQAQLALVVDNLITLIKAENRRKLTMEDITSFVTKTAEESIWEFIDAIGECNKTQALNVMERLLRERSDFVIIIAMIARQFRIIAQVKSLLNMSKNYAEIASLLKLHPFVVRKAVEHSKNFTLKHLRKLYQKLVKTDLVVKQGRFDEKLALDLLIATL